MFMKMVLKRKRSHHLKICDFTSLCVMCNEESERGKKKEMEASSVWFLIAFRRVSDIEMHSNNFSMAWNSIHGTNIQLNIENMN